MGYLYLFEFNCFSFKKKRFFLILRQFISFQKAVKASSSSSSPNTIIDLQVNNHFKCYVIGDDCDFSVGQSIQRVLVHTHIEQMLYVNCVAFASFTLCRLWCLSCSLYIHAQLLVHRHLEAEE